MTNRIFLEKTIDSAITLINNNENGYFEKFSDEVLPFIELQNSDDVFKKVYMYLTRQHIEFTKESLINELKTKKDNLPENVKCLRFIKEHCMNYSSSCFNSQFEVCDNWLPGRCGHIDIPNPCELISIENYEYSLGVCKYCLELKR